MLRAVSGVCLLRFRQTSECGLRNEEQLQWHGDVNGSRKSSLTNYISTHAQLYNGDIGSGWMRHSVVLRSFLFVLAFLASWPLYFHKNFNRGQLGRITAAGKSRDNLTNGRPTPAAAPPPYLKNELHWRPPERRIQIVSALICSHGKKKIRKGKQHPRGLLRTNPTRLDPIFDETIGRFVARGALLCLRVG